MKCRRLNPFQAWWRSHAWITKTDLGEMEQRLTKAITEASIAPPIESAALLVQSALDQLDASIPDKHKKGE